MKSFNIARCRTTYSYCGKRTAVLSVPLPRFVGRSIIDEVKVDAFYVGSKCWRWSCVTTKSGCNDMCRQQPSYPMPSSHQEVEPMSPVSNPVSNVGQWGGKGLAGAAASLAVVAFAVTRLFGTPSLTSLEQHSVPLDVALRNDKPTMIEFYANW